MNNITDDFNKLRMNIEFTLIQTSELNSLKQENEQMKIKIKELQNEKELSQKVSRMFQS